MALITCFSKYLSLVTKILVDLELVYWKRCSLPSGIYIVKGTIALVNKNLCTSTDNIIGVTTDDMYLVHRSSNDTTKLLVSLFGFIYTEPQNKIFVGSTESVYRITLFENPFLAETIQILTENVVTEREKILKHYLDRLHDWLEKTPARKYIEQLNKLKTQIESIYQRKYLYVQTDSEIESKSINHLVLEDKNYKLATELYINTMFWFFRFPIDNGKYVRQFPR